MSPPLFEILGQALGGRNTDDISLGASVLGGLLRGR
jgi:hypothetical protein